MRLDDREVVNQISENIYMQYFLGYPSFVNGKPFDASLFVEIRKRLGMETINEINERIVKLKAGFESKDETVGNDSGDQKGDDHIRIAPVEQAEGLPEDPPVTHKGKVIIDATACPQDIAYPTDLDLLSDARQKSEELIDLLYDKFLHGQKPRTYRQNARREYLASTKAQEDEKANPLGHS
jgi:hypothetical protein